MWWNYKYFGYCDIVSTKKANTIATRKTNTKATNVMNNVSTNCGGKKVKDWYLLHTVL